MKIIISICLTLFIISCSSIDNQKTAGSPTYKPEIRIYDTGDSLRIYLTYIDADKDNNAKREFIQSIKSVEIDMLLGKRIINRVVMDDHFVTNDLSDSNRILVFASIGHFKWSNPRTRPDEFDIELKLKAGSKLFRIIYPYWKLKSDISVGDNSALDLIPVEAKLDSSSYLLGLIAIRRDSVDEEYLPSSEDFRAEIYSVKGKLYWSSNSNLNYTTQIEEVKPIKLGDAYFYSTIWMGLSNNKRKMPTKDYMLRMTIPAKPKRYFMIKQFNPELEW